MHTRALPITSSSLMKKVLLFVGLVGLGLSSCNKKSQCPAYSGTKDASRISSTITAQHTAPAERQ